MPRYIAHHLATTLQLLFIFLVLARYQIFCITLHYIERIKVIAVVYKGRYVVEVMYNGRHVVGSPFHQEIFDPRNVKLESGKTTGTVGDDMSLDGIKNIFI